MAVKYIPFFPEPIEGQALLNNFNRTLRYRGVEDLSGRLRRGMPYYEVETTEKVGDADTDNMIIRGECLSACAYLKEQGIKVDLVYIDPPFASGADYAKKVCMCVATRRWRRQSHRQRQNLTSTNSKPLRRQCSAMCGTRRSTSTGCTRILWPSRA